eukprot:3320984-Prymnesium_polylepis.1
MDMAMDMDNDMDMDMDTWTWTWTWTWHGHGTWDMDMDMKHEHEHAEKTSRVPCSRLVGRVLWAIRMRFWEVAGAPLIIDNRDTRRLAKFKIKLDRRIRRT